MKKYLFIFILIIICAIVFIFVFGRKSTIYDCVKEENIDEYKVVADYLRENYKNMNFQDMTENYTTMKIINLNKINNIDEIKSEIEITKSEFNYAWVNESSCIFWQDERKIIGILFSSNPKKDIKELKKWYNGMESEKINNNCYCIGQWNYL